MSAPRILLAVPAIGAGIAIAVLSVNAFFAVTGEPTPAPGPSPVAEVGR